MKRVGCVILRSVLAMALIQSQSIAAPPTSSPSESSGDLPSSSTQDVPDDMKWEPPWRSQGDCGPVAIYLLMQLLTYEISIDQIKEVVPTHPVLGCSMQDLVNGCNQLGFPAELRFVTPIELADLPMPFVVHKTASIEKGTGHFIVVVAFSQKNRTYAIIHPEQEQLLWVPEATMLNQFSGYVMVPVDAAVNRWEQITRYIAIVLGLAIAVSILMGRASVPNAAGRALKSK
jgi:hypothetical protein